MVQVLGLHHVSINVRDVEEGVEFYEKTLGLARRVDRPRFSFDGAWLDVGGQQVHLLRKPVPEAVGQHFAIEVGDLSLAVSELRAKGLEVSEPVPVGRNRQAFLSDPSGNVIELQEVVAASLA